MYKFYCARGLCNAVGAQFVSLFAEKKNDGFVSKSAGNGESLQNTFRAVENIPKSMPQNNATLPVKQKVSAALPSNAILETVKETSQAPMINQ